MVKHNVGYITTHHPIKFLQQPHSAIRHAQVSLATQKGHCCLVVLRPDEELRELESLSLTIKSMYQIPTNRMINLHKKGCRSFAGMVNFVSIFCPELQKLLKPIYDLTRKGGQFLWGEEQQKALDEIKHRLQRPPVLHLPNRHG